MAAMPKSTIAMEAKQAIAALARQYITYANARDIDKLLTLFTRDGRIFAPYQPIAEGHSVLRQHFYQTFAEYDMRDLKAEITSIELSGDVAFVFGSFTVNMRTPTGKRVQDRGKWLVYLRCERGAWRIAAHCLNTDLPILVLAGL